MTAISDEITLALATLPDSPGVYVFKNAEEQIIYIGKALSLRSRVRSYWNQNSWPQRPKLAVLMPKVKTLDVIVTNSEKEALLLEAVLVRQHRPRYNVTLKDDKRYPWLAITYDVAFPRLIMVRDPARFRKENPKARVFGPYVETGAMWETVRVLRKVFPMRQRKTPLFKDRPCMNFHIGLCLGPCQKLVGEEEYDHMVKQVELFLAGRQSEVLFQLKHDMETASSSLEFEQAAKIRDRLALLQRVIEKQQVFFQNQKVNQDVIAECHTNRMISVCLMKIREGKMISSECLCVPLLEKTSWDEAYRSFIDQYYATCEDIAVPSEVVLQHEVDDMSALQELLNAKSGLNVKISLPRRGNKVELLEMAEKNAEIALDKEVREQSDADAKVLLALTTLQEQLAIPVLPRRIECFDISNIQGSDNVASMVVFENAQPKKSDYRLFKIQAVEGTANDFASMKEVVTRRYGRLVRENKPMPDLIIIDGGKGQLGAAVEALNDIDAPEVAIIGLAKKQEEVYFPSNRDPVLLPRRGDALFLLQRARDEAHRFALTYHRKLRAKRSLRSSLDLFEGVGPARRKALLDHFGSFEKMKAASLDDLLGVPGLPKKLATTIYNSLSLAKKEPAQESSNPAENQPESESQPGGA